MSDLHENLNSAFTAVEPGPAPVEAVMLAGKRIRIRRRAGLLAGAVAVVVAAVVGVPAIAHQAASPSPASGHIRVTVNPPGPHSPAGLIASGLVGTVPWDVIVKYPGTGDCTVTGINLSLVQCTGPLTQPDGDPVSFNGAGGEPGNGTQYFVSYGPVAKDVVSLRVTLADGTVLNPLPTTVGGVRMVAFASPEDVPVESVTAYSSAGEIATAIPFNGQDGDGLPSFVQWQRPGQPVPARFSGTIASGTADGQAWRAIAYLGPWGTCVVIGADAACFSPAQHPSTSAAGGAGGGPSEEWGLAAPSVSYLIVTPTGGAPTRVGVAEVGGEKFWAFGLTKHEQMGGRFTAYDAAGHQVASGGLLN
ncbi:MAG TPA: hypothetical protein VHZ33_29300 [Trebonia sp.]|nr:hypothetical protein [Trebonia sp.]